MKIYSLGVKFPYVTVSRIGKQHTIKEEIMLMRNGKKSRLQFPSQNIII